MVWRHVQRREVVEVGLDFGAFGDLETHADEDVFQALPRLGHDVRMPARAATEVFGEIHRLARGGTTRCITLEFAEPLCHERFDGLSRFVDGAACSLAGLDVGDRPQRRLEPDEHTALARVFVGHSAQRVDVGGRPEGVLCGFQRRSDLGGNITRRRHHIESSWRRAPITELRLADFGPPAWTFGTGKVALSQTTLTRDVPYHVGW